MMFLSRMFKGWKGKHEEDDSYDPTQLKKIISHTETLIRDKESYISALKGKLILYEKHPEIITSFKETISIEETQLESNKRYLKSMKAHLND